jgi:hypothetical protein
LIPVAILTTARFDASTVDPGTVCFGDAEEPSQRDCSGVHSNVADIDNDSDRDLRLLFETQQTGIDAEDTQACLTASLLDTTQIEGCDFIRIS